MMMEEKKELRKEIRQRLRLLLEEEKSILSQIVMDRLENSPEFQQAHTILLFWSLPDEVDTHELILRHAEGKTILLPVVIGDDTEIRRFRGMEYMKKGAFNIDEPEGEAVVDYSAIDLVVVPGMAFDREGNRLGRGKGYYDRLLKKIDAPTIAICFPCQVVDHVPHEEWDVRIDAII